MKENIKSHINIPDGYFAVLQCEVMTGIVLRVDRQRYNGSGETWILFPTLNQAEAYIRSEIISYPHIEYQLFNSAYEQIAVVKDEEYVSRYIAERARLYDKKWWKFWQ